MQSTTNNIHQYIQSTVAYIILVGGLSSAMVGLLFTLIASSKRPKYKPNVEFDDLAHGLNIDLGYYLGDGNHLESKKKYRKKEEELAALLNR